MERLELQQKPILQPTLRSKGAKVITVRAVSELRELELPARASRAD